MTWLRAVELYLRLYNFVVSLAWRRTLGPSNMTLRCRDGKRTRTSKNEPNRNPGFAKNRTDPEPKCHGSYSVLSLNESVGTYIHTFHGKRDILLYLGLTKFSYQPND